MVMRPSLGDRFWSKVDKRGPDDCWIWLASKRGKSGYGQFRLAGAMRVAHRVAWMLTQSDIPRGDHHGTMCILHRCDNPSCVNPAHLWLGTQAENNADSAAKGRTRGYGKRGAASGHSKVIEADVLAIRASPESEVVLGRRYGISRAAVGAIRRRVNWAWLDDIVAADGTPRLVGNLEETCTPASW